MGPNERFIQRVLLMIDIDLMNLSSVNLNHLVAFDALLSERSVTRAAKRLGVTQSAMSNALRQLRLMFDDPLFMRRSVGVEPTPRALAIADPVRRGLAAFGAALSPATFDPKTATRAFVVATSDYVELVVLPALLSRLAAEAPGIRLDVVPWGLHEVPESLARGEVDLMLGYYGRVPPAHHEEILFAEEFLCLARARHPTLAKRPTLQKWTAVPHVVVSQKPGSTSSVDRALAARGLARTIGVRVSHFSIVPQVVAQTDFTAALSRRIAEPAARALRLVTFASPLPLGKSRVGQVWHDRLDADAGHRWLRNVIKDVTTRI
jgi:DNA-binding transcriptional LysR family regulator